MNLGSLSLLWQPIAYLVFVCFFIWKYKKNKIIVLGVITLGVAGLISELAKFPRFPGWLDGVFVLVFMLLGAATVLFACFSGAKYLFRRFRRSDTADDSRAAQEEPR